MKPNTLILCHFDVSYNYIQPFDGNSSVVTDRYGNYHIIPNEGMKVDKERMWMRAITNWINKNWNGNIK